MPSKPPYPQSTRLENLSLDPQGAAFGLEGRPIRLNGDGYAAPVASMQELYHHALADYYQRSAEISRQAAESRPPLLGRLLSWVGRIFARLAPGPAAPAGFPPLPPPLLREAMASSARRGPETGPPHREAAPALPVPSKIVGPPANPLSNATVPSDLKPSAGAVAPPPSGVTRRAHPPVLQVIFADQEGVHVIWQIAASKRDPSAKSRDPAEPKAGLPKLEFTYSLDSPMAQRLQDCYGQLAQLGYKIANLDAVRAVPEKPGKEKAPAKPSPEPTSPVAKAEPPAIIASDAGKAAGSRPSARSTPLEAGPRPIESVRPAAEPPNRDPSFLPGI